MANDDGFLSRWSRRKVQARTGEALPSEEPVPEKPLAAASVVGAPQSAVAVTQPPAGVQPTDAAPPKDAAAQQPEPDQAQPAAAQPPLPTMQDVMALTKESDYSAFVKPGVDPTVRNAAMKKLFSDPFFNEMDGLDIYIDDYSQPNPLPMSLARKLTSAKVLNLFETPEEKAARLAAEAAEAAKNQPVAPGVPNTPNTHLDQEPAGSQSTPPQAAEASAEQTPQQPETQAEPTAGPEEPSATPPRPTSP